MVTDLRHLARNLRRSPASAAAAVLTLSITLGAGVSIFAIVDAVLLTPPPFVDPNALVAVGEIPIDEPDGLPRAISSATFEAWRRRAGSLARLEAFDGTNLTLTGFGTAERVNANDVTPGFLPLLGVVPALGRGFEAADVGQPLAIVSDGFWRTKLGGDSRAVGRSIVLGGRAHTIVGVLPSQFVFELNAADIWRPLPFTRVQAERAGSRVSAIARLAPHAAATSLTAALDEVSGASSPPARVAATPVATAISGDATTTVALLAGAAALAALIALANLAALLIVRAIDRRRELAVRTALGAPRSEIPRQLVLEAQVLVTVGIAGGVLVAWWMTPGLARVVLEQYPSLANRPVAVSWRLAALVALAASICAWMCAFVPSLAAARWNLVGVLRRGATPRPREVVLRRAFVAGELALAFTLIACVTCIGDSLRRLLEANPGFDAHGVIALQVSVPAAGYDVDRTVSFYSALQSALDDRLGRGSSGIVNEIPLTGDRGRGLVHVRPDDRGRDAVLREATPAYFEVMRIPVVAGRAFDARDNRSAPPRVVISRSLSDILFSSRLSIGRHIWLGGSEPAEVVGVVGDVKHRALDERPLPTVYLAALQRPSRSNILVIRTTLPVSDAIDVTRDEVARLDGNVPVYRVRSMQEVLAASAGMAARKVLAVAFALFALLAVVLGAIGLFGMIAHDVATRRAELAVRIALGADAMRIVGTTIAPSVVTMSIGLAIGGALWLGASRMLTDLGFGISPLGMSTALPAAVMLIVGAAAVLPAARRAANTDPLIAIRSE